MLNRECHQQLSSLFIYENQERNKIRDEFHDLKRLNALKIREILQQLHPTKKYKPVPRFQSKRKKTKEEVRQMSQNCIDQGAILPSSGVFEIFDSYH